MVISALSGKARAGMRGAPPKIVPGLAAWMARAGIPYDVIGMQFGVSARRVGQAVRLVNNAAAREALGEQRQKAKEARALASKARLAWCPPEMLGFYKLLKKSKRILAADARAIIEADLLGKRAAEPAHA